MSTSAPNPEPRLAAPRAEPEVVAPASRPEATEVNAEPQLVTKVRARRADFKQRSPVYRGAFVVLGFVLVVGGMAMLVLPGPAFVVIPIGLALLSLQFSWAERLLDRSLVEAEKAKRKAQGTTTRQRVLTAIAGAIALAAFVVLAILYDIPLVPYI